MSNRIIIIMALFQVGVAISCLIEKKYWWTVYWVACVTANVAILGMNLGKLVK